MALRTALRAIFSALALSLLLAVSGCNFDGAFEVGGNETPSLNPDAIVTARVVGSVGDGPIVDARLRVFSNSGQQLMETRSSSTADYEITVRTQGRNYPLTIVADEGVDLVTGLPPDFSLVSVIMGPGNREVVNLNPYSTIIVKAAQKSGGISNETIATATEALIQRYGFGLDSSLVAHPIFTPMDDSNVHVIVKASETLGEMVRRTRDVLPAGGAYPDGDAVVDALAADFTDGWIDGKGAKGHDPRIAAVANVVSAAVMVEAMANRLHVYGVDATKAMDNAVRQVRPNAPASINTRNVPISADALAQSKRALQAAALMTSDDRVRQAIDALAATDPGATNVQGLPSGIESVLKDAVLRAASIVDDGELEAINSGDRPGTDSDSTHQDDSQSREDTDPDTGHSEPPKTPDGGSDLEGDNPPGSAIGDGSSQDEATEADPEPATNESERHVSEDALTTLWKNDLWLAFDGVNNLVNTRLPLKEMTGTSFTAEAIIQYTGTNSRTWSPIFGASHQGNYQQSESFFIGKDRENDRLNVNLGGLDFYKVDSAGLFDGQERHLALVFDQSAQEIRIFVDQVLIHTRRGVTGPLTGASELLVGAAGHSTDERWIGWVGPARATGQALEPPQFLTAGPVAPRPNSAPTISGTPTTTLVVNNPWSFTPTASDPDGDTLTFSITGEPSWASFDSKTGTLSGTPSTAGSHGPITITVSDGKASSSLKAFTLRVDAPTLGTATVSWEPPTRRTDGSALTDLAGYRVYYGKSSGSLTHVINIDKVGQTSQHIENLDAGTWYFAVTAYCSKGLESPKSEIGSKKI
jgi:hypothetical protein